MLTRLSLNIPHLDHTSGVSRCKMSRVGKGNFVLWIWPRIFAAASFRGGSLTLCSCFANSAEFFLLSTEIHGSVHFHVRFSTSGDRYSASFVVLGRLRLGVLISTRKVYRRAAHSISHSKAVLVVDRVIDNHTKRGSSHHHIVSISTNHMVGPL